MGLLIKNKNNGSNWNSWLAENYSLTDYECISSEFQNYSFWVYVCGRNFAALLFAVTWLFEYKLKCLVYSSNILFYFLVSSLMDYSNSLKVNQRSVTLSFHLLSGDLAYFFLSCDLSSLIGWVIMSSLWTLFPQLYWNIHEKWVQWVSFSFWDANIVSQSGWVQFLHLNATLDDWSLFLGSPLKTRLKV